jgi:hypothetical protein
MAVDITYHDELSCVVLRILSQNHVTLLISESIKLWNKTIFNTDALFLD